MFLPWAHKTAAVHDVDEDSTMVAIYPPKGWRDLLAAHAHPSQRDKLHVTLVYLGKTTPEQAQKALEITQREAAKHAPFKLDSNAAGIFDNVDAIVRTINPSGVGLNELRADIYNALDAEGLIDKQTHGFVPHMTLEYHDDRRLPENWERVAQLPFGQWTVTEVRVVRGDNEVGRARLTKEKDAMLHPYVQGYTRFMKAAGLKDDIVEGAAKLTKQKTENDAIVKIKEKLHESQQHKDAGLKDDLLEAGTQMPWQEGIQATIDALRGRLGGLRSGIDDVGEAVVRKGQPSPQIRRSIPVDPRMRTYQGAFGQ